VIFQFGDLRRQKCCFCVSLCLTLWALVKCNREKKCWGWFSLLLCSNGTKHTGVYGRSESAAVFCSFPRRLTTLQHPFTLVILTISINTQTKYVGATMLVTELRNFKSVQLPIWMLWVKTKNNTAIYCMLPYLIFNPQEIMDKNKCLTHDNKSSLYRIIQPHSPLSKTAELKNQYKAVPSIMTVWRWRPCVFGTEMHLKVTSGFTRAVNGTAAFEWIGWSVRERLVYEWPVAPSCPARAQSSFQRP